jgi:hypothetical protein
MRAVWRGAVAISDAFEDEAGGRLLRRAVPVDVSCVGMMLLVCPPAKGQFFSRTTCPPSRELQLPADASYARACRT